MRTANKKLIEYITGELELYDLETDPYEMQNAADDLERVDEIEELRSKIRALRDCAGQQEYGVAEGLPPS